MQKHILTIFIKKTQEKDNFTISKIAEISNQLSLLVSLLTCIIILYFIYSDPFVQLCYLLSLDSFQILD